MFSGPRTATGRAQRASARHLNGTTAPTDGAAAGDPNAPFIAPPVSGDSDFTMIMDDEPTISRSNSSQNIAENIAESSSQSTNGRPKRKDKGKGKEVDGSVVRVKEEPKAISLDTPEPLLLNQVNLHNTLLLVLF